MKKVKLTDEQRELLRIMDVDIHSYDEATNTCELRDCIFDALQRLKVNLEEVKELEFNEPWKPKVGEKYFYIDNYGNTTFHNYSKNIWEFMLFDVDNCFKTREQAEARAKKDAIDRKLEAFSMANGGDEIDWNNKGQRKWYICYNGVDKKIDAVHIGDRVSDNIGSSVFICQKTAQEAIRRFGKEFLEAYKIEEAQVGK